MAIGAATPFRALLLQELQHHDLWLSSFEISALFGEIDDGSIQSEDVPYLFRKIYNKAIDANLFVDCEAIDSNSAAIEAALRLYSGRAAMICVQNLRREWKVNSFASLRPEALLRAQEAAALTLHCIELCPESLLFLRLENATLNHTPEQICVYVSEIVEMGGRFDGLFVSFPSSNIHELKDILFGLRELLGNSCLLAINAAGFMDQESFMDLLDSNLIIVPNLALRSEFKTLTNIYSDVLQRQFHNALYRCASMKEVLAWTDRQGRNNQISKPRTL